MDQPRQTPMYDPISHLVYVTRGDDVETTIVNGKVLMRGGQGADAERRRRCSADARRPRQQVRAAVPVRKLHCRTPMYGRLRYCSE